MSSILGPLDDGPKWNVMSDTDVLERARDLPVGLGEMFVETFKESFITSPGLGTAIREGSTPDPVASRDVTVPTELTPRDPMAVPRLGGEDGPVRFQPPAGVFLESEPEYQQRRKDAGALSKEEWQASSSFRTKIPYDPGMTADRASALAAWHDESEARQAIINKGPGGIIGNTVWIGGMLAGSALDPVNYIPIFGPEVRAAQIAKFGRLGGSALTSAGDAALNTAIMSGLTAGTRQSFGDDVSWQTFVTDVAIGAVIGGAFGAATSRWEGWQQSRAANEINAVVEARAALNDAMADVLHGRPVEITPTVADAVEKAATRLDPVRPPESLLPNRVTDIDELKARQAGVTFDDIYARAAEFQPELGRVGKEISDITGAEFKDPGVKDRETAFTKIERKNYSGPEHLTDVSRGGFIVDTPSQMDDIVNALAERYRILDEGFAVNAAGYGDRKVLVQATNGTIAEIQIIPRAMMAAKKNGGHKLYEEQRSLPKGDPRIDELNERMSKHYGSAVQRMGAEWAGIFDTSKAPNLASNLDRQASSRMTPAESATSRSSTSTQGPDGSRTANALSGEGSRTAGLQSQLTNFIGDTSDSSVAQGGLVRKMDAAAVAADAPDPSVTAAAGRVGKRPASAAAEFGMDQKWSAPAQPAEPAAPAKQTVTVTRGEDGRINGAEISKPAQELADQFGIDTKSGDFPEMAEFDQLVALGRVTPAELDAVRKASEIQAQTEDYARALEAAAICRVGA